MPDQRPTPFEALPRLTRRDADAATAFALGVPGLSLRAISESLQKPLGGLIGVRPFAVETWPPGSAFARPDPNLVALVLGDGTASPNGRMVLELDPAFAGFLIDRALGAAAPEPRLSPGPVTDGERGTLAYLGGLALAHARESFRALGVISTTDALAHALGPDAAGVLLGQPAQLELAGVVGWARLWAAPASVALRKGGPLDEGMPLELVLVAGNATLPAGQMRALEIGDVLVPDTWMAQPEAERWHGELSAASALGGPTFVLAASHGALTFARREPGAPIERWRSPMSEPADEMALDVPVEIAIEVGRLAMTVGELSALKPGAIVASGLPSTGRLWLRVAGRVIAEGELVLVDGELGVKITKKVG